MDDQYDNYPPNDEASDEQYGWSRDAEKEGEQQKSWKERYQQAKENYKQVKKAKQQVKKAGKKAAKQTAKKAEKQAAKQAGKAGAKAGAKVAAKTGARAAATAGGPETAGVTIAAERLAEKDIELYTQRIKDFNNLSKLRAEELYKERTEKIKKKAKKRLLIAISLFAGFIAIMMVTTTLFEQFMTENYAPDLVAQLTTQETSLLSLTKEGPTTAAAGAQLTYTITATYNGTAEDITITDTIPVGANFVTSAQPNTYDPATRTITWHTNQTNPSNPSTGTVTFTVLVTANNVYLINYAQGTATPAVPAVGENIPPTTNDCGNAAYRLYMNRLPGARHGLNFGDPQCDFTESALQTLLHQLDPANEAFWFCIANYESDHFIPNAYNPNSTSGYGAYGLFQMNPPEGSADGQYDNGYVVWTLQTSNAVNYRNQVIHGSWAYWGTRDRCRRETQG